MLDEICQKQNSIKVKKKDFKMVMENLIASTIFFKGVLLKISINRSLNKEEKIVLERHQKKLGNIFKEENELNNLYDNPSTVSSNFLTHVLSIKECSILKFGLKYELTTCSNESNILNYAEHI